MRIYGIKDLQPLSINKEEKKRRMSSVFLDINELKSDIQSSEQKFSNIISEKEIDKNKTIYYKKERNLSVCSKNASFVYSTSNNISNNNGFLITLGIFLNDNFSLI